MRGTAMIFANKKGQVPTLLLLIMIVVIFYVLFLPPHEREALLGQNMTITGPILEAREQVLLLSADVGTLSFVREKDIEHGLPSMLLEERSNAVVLAVINPFTASKGWLIKKPKQQVFTIETPDRVENVVLSFQLAKNKGNLKVRLNAVEVMDAELRSITPQTISLKKELLQKVNVLDFEVYGGGLLGSEYSFKDVQIVGDVVDSARKSSVGTFIISPEEKNNFGSGALSFYAVCNPALVGVLEVQLNGRILFSSVPSCNSINRFELVGDDLNTGKNVLNVAMASGKVRLDSVLIKSKLKPTKSYIDYFTINSTIYRDLTWYKRGRVMVRVNFVDDAKQKTADVNINGLLSVIDQSSSVYEKDITSKIREGNNYISLTPRTELNVVDVKIKVE